MRVATVTLNPALDLTVRVDGLKTNAVNVGQELRWDAGGKGVNVASFLADHGLATTVTGFLGDDNPERFEALFRAKGIDDRFVRVPGATRVGVKLVDGAAQETTDINLPGLTPSPAKLAALCGTVTSLVSSCDVFVLAGSVPPGVPSAIWAELCRELRDAGRVVVVDTSGPALAAVLDQAPTVVKPNVHELEGILGCPLGSEGRILAAARTLVDRGIALVTVSMGERGALFVTATDAWIARPPEVDVKSTVGAGDAMVAGIVAARIAGLSLAAAARLATAFSVARVTGRPTGRAEVEPLVHQVELTRPTGQE